MSNLNKDGIDIDEPRPGPFMACDGDGVTELTLATNGDRPPPDFRVYVKDKFNKVIIHCGWHTEKDLHPYPTYAWPVLARRVAACLNACLGISTEELEMLASEGRDIKGRMKRRKTA